MRTPMQFPDPERAVVDILNDSEYVDHPAGIEVPNNWVPAHGPFLQVAWDGTPTNDQIVAYPTIRVTVRAGGPTAAKNAALRAQAVLLAHPGGYGISAIRPGTGPFPSKDPDTKVPLCWFTVRASTRAALLS